MLSMLKKLDLAPLLNAVFLTPPPPKYPLLGAVVKLVVDAGGCGGVCLRLLFLGGTQRSLLGLCSSSLSSSLKS